MLHPVDSVPQWKNIINDKSGRPDAMHLSSKAVLMWPYKLVTGKQPLSAWVGPNYPNCSTVKSIDEHNGPLPAPDDVKIFGESMPLAPTPEEVDRQTWTIDCGAGCLVNVRDDPTEHVNLAKDPKYVAGWQVWDEIGYYNIGILLWDINTGYRIHIHLEDLIIRYAPGSKLH